MSVYRFPLRLLFALYFLTGLTACSVPPVGATPSRGAIVQTFGAKHLPIPSQAPTSLTVTIASELPGEIQVVSYAAPEVALDSIAIGPANAGDTAISYNADVSLEFKDGGVSIQARPGDPAPERLLLHVRVPQGCSVVVDSPRVKTEVLIDGEVKNVKAQVRQGNITVRGATGDLNLTTERGAIAVDQRERDGQNHTFELRANEGDITLFALNARVFATTTNGTIQFVGTLRPTGGDKFSEFNVKGTGDVTVALPDSDRYRFRAFGGARVITDLARDAEPCGIISPKNYDFRRRSSNVEDLGRIEIGGTYTTTSQVQGTIGDGITYFETDRNFVTVFDPLNPPPRSGGTAGNSTVGDCGRLTTDRLAANIDFNMHAGSGSIWIHQIKMK